MRATAYFSKDAGAFADLGAKELDVSNDFLNCRLPENDIIVVCQQRLKAVPKMRMQRFRHS